MVFHLGGELTGNSINTEKVGGRGGPAAHGVRSSRNCTCVSAHHCVKASRAKNQLYFVLNVKL